MWYIVGTLGFFLLMLGWGAYLDSVYYSDGAPGHRKLARGFYKGNGVYTYDNN